jgi:hypothetical protein
LPVSVEVLPEEISERSKGYSRIFAIYYWLFELADFPQYTRSTVQGAGVRSPATHPHEELASRTAEGVWTGARAWSVCLWTCLVDRDVAATKTLAIQGSNGRLGLGRIAHGNKRKTAGSPGGSIGNQANFGDSAILREQIFKVVFRRGKREISDKQFHNN